MIKYEPTIRIVIIDDDFSIRFVINSLITKSKYYKNIKVFTCANGVEGVGYVLITHPDIIIIDSTLPAYSGLEILNFLKTNKAIENLHIPTLVIHENNKLPELSEQYVTINKNDKRFVDRLIDFIEDGISLSDKKHGNTEPSVYRQGKMKLITKIKLFFGKKIIKWANLGDNILFKKDQSHTKFGLIYSLGWFVSKLISSFYLSLFYIVSGKGVEENIDQEKQDSIDLRVRVYPTIAAILTSLFLLLFQVILFVAGGIIILSTRITQAIGR